MAASLSKFHVEDTETRITMRNEAQGGTDSTVEATLEQTTSVAAQDKENVNVVSDIVDSSWAGQLFRQFGILIRR